MRSTLAWHLSVDKGLIGSCQMFPPWPAVLNSLPLVQGNAALCDVIPSSSVDNENTHFLLIISAEIEMSVVHSRKEKELKMIRVLPLAQQVSPKRKNWPFRCLRAVFLQLFPGIFYSCMSEPRQSQQHQPLKWAALWAMCIKEGIWSHPKIDNLLSCRFHHYRILTIFML